MGKADQRNTSPSSQSSCSGSIQSFFTAVSSVWTTDAGVPVLGKSMRSGTGWLCPRPFCRRSGKQCPCTGRNRPCKSRLQMRTCFACVGAGGMVGSLVMGWSHRVDDALGLCFFQGKVCGSGDISDSLHSRYARAGCRLSHRNSGYTGIRRSWIDEKERKKERGTSASSRPPNRRLQRKSCVERRGLGRRRVNERDEPRSQADGESPERPMGGRSAIHARMPHYSPSLFTQGVAEYSKSMKLRNSARDWTHLRPILRVI